MPKKRWLSPGKAAVLCLILITILWLPSATVGKDRPSTPSLTKLVQQINGPGVQEFIPAIRAAIRSALSLRYLMYTAEKLRALAADAHHNTADLRAAAGRALAERLQAADLSRDELMKIAVEGKTPEVRDAAGTALSQMLVSAMRSEELTPDEINELVSNGASEELRRIAAWALFEYFKCSLRHADQQAVVEAIVSGKSAEVEGVTLDGSILHLREVAGRFLTDLYLYFPQRMENPVRELSAIATDAGLTPEFRSAASHALAHYLEISALSQEELEELTIHGESVELREAAAGALGRRLAKAFAAGEVTLTDLYKLAARGTSLQLGAAAIPGLTLYFSGGQQLDEERFNLATCNAGGLGCATPDGWIDWSGRDSDYLSSGHGIYYRFDLRCNTRVIISLSVPFFADFDLFLIEDTWPYENRLDSGDRGICSSRRGTGSNEYIDCKVPDNATYFIYVAAYSGSGPYNISIKFDW